MTDIDQLKAARNKAIRECLAFCDSLIAHIGTKTTASSFAYHCTSGIASLLENENDINAQNGIDQLTKDLATAQAEIARLSLNNTIMLTTANKMANDARLSPQQRDALRGYHDAMVEALSQSPPSLSLQEYKEAEQLKHIYEDVNRGIEG